MPAQRAGTVPPLAVHLQVLVTLPHRVAAVLRRVRVQVIGALDHLHAHREQPVRGVLHRFTSGARFSSCSLMHSTSSALLMIVSGHSSSPLAPGTRYSAPVKLIPRTYCAAFSMLALVSSSNSRPL